MIGKIGDNQMKELKSNPRFRTALAVLAGFAIFLAGTTFYQLWAASSDEKAYPPPGELTDINDSTLHTYEKGEGGETLVFTAGSGTPSPYADMYHLQETLSEDYHTILYERPGYGWSEEAAEERTVDTVTGELEATLEARGKEPPYTFVAHSMAAMEVLRYAQLYPEKTAGIVLIDGVNPANAAVRDTEIPMRARLYQGAKTTGLLRLAVQNDSVASAEVSPYKTLPENVRRMNEALTLQNMWNDTMIAERELYNENGITVAEGGDIGDIPLTVLTSDFPHREGWKESQKELVSYSSRADQKVISGTGHFIHHHRPEAVITEIRKHLQSQEIEAEPE
nr:alpha/beta hydrolase [Alkalicoccus halolimnae]